MSIPVKDKALALLEALFDDHAVKVGHYTYALSDQNALSVVAHNETLDQEELFAVWPGKFELQGFISIAENMTDAEFYAVIENNLRNEGGL